MWGSGSDLKNMSDDTDPNLYRIIPRNRSTECDNLSPSLSFSSAADDTKRSCRKASVNTDIPAIILVDPCTSSLDMAWHYHRKGMLPEWGSVLTPTQSAGRGQFGREWLSPVGNIYVALRLPTPSERCADITSVMTGYLIVTGLVNCGFPAKLKWPNDILVNGKKVGGILLEERDGILIAGVGLNLISCPTDEQLREQHAVPAGILNEADRDFTPLSLWKQLVAHSRDLYYKTIRKANPEAMIRKIQPNLAFIGSTVRFVDRDSVPCEAEVLGLSSNGGLRLMTDNGVMEIRSGSIYRQVVTE